MITKKEMTPQVSSWAVAKRFLALFLPSLALMGGIAMVFYYTDVRNERVFFETKEAHRVEMQKEIIASEFKSIVSDLMFISEYGLREILESDDAGSRRALAEMFLLFSAKRGLYDQIRFLDETGMEVVRVNFNNGKPYVVPEEQLQSKAQRYYFKDTFSLERGEVFVSPFDLNIEQGEIEQPLKPVIRFGTPVFDAHGRKRGIMILNYLGAKLIYKLKRMEIDFPGQVWLLNSDGFWLKGPRPEDEWGFMYEDGKNRTFGNALPEVWERISVAKSGRYHNADGMFTFATVYPLSKGQKSSVGSGKAFEPSAGRLKAKKYYWHIVSHVPPNALNSGSLKFLTGLLQVYAVLVVLLATGSWFLARSNESRKRLEEQIKERNRELRKKSEELEEQKNYAQSVLYSIADGVYTTDLDRRITSWNRGAEIITGHKSEEVIGKPCRDILKHVDEEGNGMCNDGCPFVECFRTGEATPAHAVLARTPDNRQIPVAVSVAPVRDAGGNIIGGVQVFRDISREREIDRMKSDFVSAVSHELRTPLASIQGFAEMLMDGDVEDDETSKEYLQIIVEESERLGELISDVLNLTRIESGKMEMHKTLLSLGDVIERTVSVFSQQASESDIKIDVKIVDNVPEIEADEDMMKQVMENLVSNAIKYSPDGGLITITVAADGDFITVSVSDTGIGIPPGALDKVFERFYRVDDERVRVAGGTGLGLSLVKEMIEKHDGEIWVESEPDKGSAFTFRLPR